MGNTRSTTSTVEDDPNIPEVSFYGATYFIPIFGHPQLIHLFVNQNRYRTNPNGLFGTFILSNYFQNVTKKLTNEELLTSLPDFPLSDIISSPIARQSNHFDHKLGPIRPNLVHINPLNHHPKTFLPPDSHPHNGNDNNNNTNPQPPQSSDVPTTPSTIPFIRLSFAEPTRISLDLLPNIFFFHGLGHSASTYGRLHSGHLNSVQMSQKLLPFHGIKRNTLPLPLVFNTKSVYDTQWAPTTTDNNNDKDINPTSHGKFTVDKNIDRKQLSSDNYHTYGHLHLPPPILYQVVPLFEYSFGELTHLPPYLNTPAHHAATIIILDQTNSQSFVILDNFVRQTHDLLSKGCIFSLLDVDLHILLLQSARLDETVIQEGEIFDILSKAGFHVDQINVSALSLRSLPEEKQDLTLRQSFSINPNQRPRKQLDFCHEKSPYQDYIITPNPCSSLVDMQLFHTPKQTSTSGSGDKFHGRLMSYRRVPDGSHTHKLLENDSMDTFTNKVTDSVYTKYLELFRQGHFGINLYDKNGKRLPQSTNLLTLHSNNGTCPPSKWPFNLKYLDPKASSSLIQTTETICQLNLSKLIQQCKFNCQNTDPSIIITLQILLAYQKWLLSKNATQGLPEYPRINHYDHNWDCVGTYLKHQFCHINNPRPVPFPSNYFWACGFDVDINHLPKEQKDSIHMSINHATNKPYKIAKSSRILTKYVHPLIEQSDALIYTVLDSNIENTLPTQIDASSREEFLEMVHNPPLVNLLPPGQLPTTFEFDSFFLFKEAFIIADQNDAIRLSLLRPSALSNLKGVYSDWSAQFQSPQAPTQTQNTEHVTTEGETQTVISIDSVDSINSSTSIMPFSTLENKTTNIVDIPDNYNGPPIQPPLTLLKPHFDIAPRLVPNRSDLQKGFEVTRMCELHEKISKDKSHVIDSLFCVPDDNIEGSLPFIEQRRKLESSKSEVVPNDGDNIDSVNNETIDCDTNQSQNGVFQYQALSKFHTSATFQYTPKEKVQSQPLGNNEKQPITINMTYFTKNALEDDNSTPAFAQARVIAGGHFWLDKIAFAPLAYLYGVLIQPFIYLNHSSRQALASQAYSNEAEEFLTPELIDFFKHQLENKHDGVDISSHYPLAQIASDGTLVDHCDCSNEQGQVGNTMYDGSDVGCRSGGKFSQPIPTPTTPSSSSMNQPHALLSLPHPLFDCEHFTPLRPRGLKPNAPLPPTISHDPDLTNFFPQTPESQFTLTKWNEPSVLTLNCPIHFIILCANDVVEDDEYDIKVAEVEERLKESYADPKRRYDPKFLGDPLSRTQFNYYKKTLPLLYKRKLTNGHAHFIAGVSPEKIEKLLHIHFIRADEYVPLFKSIEEDAIELRLKMYKMAAQMPSSK